jgi:hypothetical protein
VRDDRFQERDELHAVQEQDFYFDVDEKDDELVGVVARREAADVVGQAIEGASRGGCRRGNL